MRQTPAIIFLLMAVIVFTGCDDKQIPPDLIDEETYINLLIEFHLARAYAISAPGDSVKIDSLNRKILKEYGINAGQFKRTHEYYQAQIDEQNERISTAIDRLKMEKIEKKDSSATEQPQPPG